MYRKFDKQGNGVIISLYMDDMLIFGICLVQVQVQGPKYFLSWSFQMKDMGEANMILDIKIIRDSSRIKQSPAYYTQKMFKRFSMLNMNPLSNPKEPV